MDLFLFIGLLIVVIIWLVHVEMFLRKLNQVSSDTYQKLGSPSVIGKRQSGLPILRFMLRREYRHLGDESFVRMGNRIIVHFVVTMALLAVFAVSIAQFLD
jgi:hypothetical protein